MKLTIAKWLTPNGRWIHKTGLTPDIAVAAAPEGSGADPVLDAALNGLQAVGDWTTAGIEAALKAALLALTWPTGMVMVWPLLKVTTSGVPVTALFTVAV